MVTFFPLKNHRIKRKEAAVFGGRKNSFRLRWFQWVFVIGAIAISGYGGSKVLDAASDIANINQEILAAQSVLQQQQTICQQSVASAQSQLPLASPADQPVILQQIQQQAINCVQQQATTQGWIAQLQAQQTAIAAQAALAAQQATQQQQQLSSQPATVQQQSQVTQPLPLAPNTGQMPVNPVNSSIITPAPIVTPAQSMPSNNTKILNCPLKPCRAETDWDQDKNMCCRQP